MTQTVLIAGAGPVGLTMAVEFARYGVPVRIVDKSAGPSTTSKAIVVWPRTMELLDRAGCAEAFAAAGHKAFGANMFSNDRRIGHIDVREVASPYRFVLMLAQSETERLLEEKLAALGVRVERQTELTGLQATASGVRATLHRADGAEETAAADWLIGCDGARSPTRHALGFGFPGESLHHDWLLADLHLTGMPVPDTELAGYLHREGVVMFFPLAPGRYRLIADLGAADPASRPPEPTLDGVRALIARRAPASIAVSDAIWLSAFRINERQVERYRAGRVFLAGDAAHVHSPAGGQGMNTGMQDAINLAWKLALRCHGTAGAEALLDSYDDERHPVGAAVVKGAGRLTQAALVSNPVSRAVRDFAAHLILGIAPARHALVDAVTEVAIGYPDSPLTAAADERVGRLRPGERVEPRAGEPPFGGGSAPRFAVLAAHDSGFDGVRARFPALVEPTPRPPPDPAGIWLVRPDGYVGLTAAAGNWGAVVDYLRGLGAS